jgi:hypothetical protein
MGISRVRILFREVYKFAKTSTEVSVKYFSKAILRTGLKIFFKKRFIKNKV